jgi:putative ABC transport system permease protein
MKRLNLAMPAMFGILRIAYKLLVNDRSKFVALLVGTTFAVFLMVQMTSMFSGVMSRASATVVNIGAKMWVMDPSVQTVANTIPLPDYTLDEVRSIPGVKYAVPLYSGGALLKLHSGAYQAVNIVGLDDSSLLGRPQLVSGNIQDIFAENAFIAIGSSDNCGAVSGYRGPFCRPRWRMVELEIAAIM